MTWLAPAATFFLPVAMIAAAIFLFANDGSQGYLLAGLLLTFPLGLLAGYVMVGAPMRGLAAVGLAYLALVGSIALIFMVPTAFEDAGTLLLIVAVLLGGGLSIGVGFVAWDVYKLAAARPERLTP